MRSWAWMWEQVRMVRSGWRSFARCLRGDSERGVQLVTSDAHLGLRDAIATVFASASWQRCRTHFMTSLLTKIPRSAQPWVATMVRTIYQQPSAKEVHMQIGRVVDQLSDRFPDASSPRISRFAIASSSIP